MAIERSPEVDRVALRSETLYAVIGVVASAPDLDRVLDGIVDLLTEATACHACFVYLRDGEPPAAARRLADLRAPRRPRGHGRRRGARRLGRPQQDARVHPRATRSTDPRMKYFPEIEEERFQSMVAVPIPARSGSVLGTVVLHTVAPREFDEGVLDVPRPHRVARRRGDRERAAVRGHAPPGRGAHPLSRLSAGDRRGRRRARSSTAS